MTEGKTIFYKTYNAEGLYDLERDVGEAVNADYNTLMRDIPKDDDGFEKGVFIVDITWEPGDD